VALPVLGLVGILKSGRNLKAPLSVDGNWKMEIQPNHLSSAPCGSLFSTVSSAPLSISQSGNHLLVSFNGGAKTTAGTIDGKTINASFAGTDHSASADCSDKAWTLTATLDPQAEPKTLSGRLAVEGCPTCAPLEFRSIRQPRSPGATR
jgi:hypothetical protein